MLEHDQDNLLIVEALSQVAKETSNDIMAEHAWALAEEFAAEEWLTVEDAVKNLRYNPTHER